MRAQFQVLVIKTSSYQCFLREGDNFQMCGIISETVEHLVFLARPLRLSSFQAMTTPIHV
jgi:hypothetical protein